MELVRQNNNMEQSCTVATVTAGGNQQRAKPQKYVSMFRIDGEPILPPLMTIEKRRQMIKYRERAMRVEQRLEEQRLRAASLKYPSRFSAVLEDREATLFTPSDTSSSGGSTERSLDSRIEQESYELLTKLIAEDKAKENETARTESPEPGFEEQQSVSAPEIGHKSETQLEERMQKLQKSDTLIYDNSSNAIIMSISDFEDMRQNSERNDAETRMYMRAASAAKTAPIVEENKLKNIPAICVDPPTPLIGDRPFSEHIDEDVTEGAGTSATTKSQLCYEEISSDESFNCAQSVTILNKDTSMFKKNNTIAAKIIKFEQYQAPSCNPNDNHSQRLNEVHTPKRSATSPSLKELTMENENKNNLSDYADGPQSESGLVRSNSFTLDYPSKALLEHMHQHSTTGTTANIRRPMLSASATRDTVESKAKRVQKAVMRGNCNSPIRLQGKMSTTNIGAPICMHKPVSTSVNAMHPFKSKRSPYDAKTIIKKTARPLKKSTTKLKSRCSLPAVPVTPKRGVQSSRSSPIDMLSEMEAEHRQRFLQLLQQQQCEQQRMQQAFEQQQQKLFQQLANEMGQLRMRSPSTPGGPVFADYRVYSPQRGNMTYNAPMLLKADGDEYAVMHSPTPQSVNSSMMSPSMCVTTSAAMDMPSDCAVPSPSYAYSMCLNKFTPRRRLFGGADHSASDSNANVHVRSANSSPTSASSQSRRVSFQ